MNRYSRLLLITGALLLASAPARSWVYPEHRDITAYAILRLDAQQRGRLDSLWAMVRAPHASRLCETPVSPFDDLEPSTIDYAAWPAIAGDHSCSADNMVHTILESDWILDVAAVAERLKRALVSAESRSDRVNALRGSDLDLLNADPEYVSRAGANNVHFLLSQSYGDTTLPAYLDECRTEDQELNSAAVYAWYHEQALEKARAIFREDLEEETRGAVARAALADEAYALHFLEDMFAAGHTAGTWGDASLRKGTHDYYNEHGLRAITWDGRPTVLVGDAWMRGQDAAEAALTVRKSLEQVLEAAFGSLPPVASQEVPPARPDALNTCLLMTMPGSESGMGSDSLLSGVMQSTPIPALPAGTGEFPRFRAEVGPFVGVATGARAGISRGGFKESQHQVSINTALEISLRLGLGLEGVMNESGDGLAFLDLGVRHDRASSSKYSASDVAQEAAEIAAAIPGRPAFTARFRMPFYLIPLDLLLTAPVLWFVSQEKLGQMAVRAANGGLIPWQAGIATSVGRFQIVAGREIGVSFYGYVNERDGIVVPITDYIFTVVVLRSIQLDFPLLEYRPFHLFAATQSSGLVMQIYTAVELPQQWKVVSPPGEDRPELDPMWHIGLRVSFDWRHYF